MSFDRGSANDDNDSTSADEDDRDDEDDQESTLYAKMDGICPFAPKSPVSTTFSCSGSYNWTGESRPAYGLKQGCDS